MNKNTNQAGFTYIDILCGILILFIGILALTSALTMAVVRTTESEQQLIAKQFVGSTLESIYSARDIKIANFGWPAIGNDDTNFGFDGLERGIFLVGKQPIYSSGGVDRIVGTKDDKCGTSGINGTTGVCNGAIETPARGFQRQIIITDICDPTRLSAGCPGAPTGSSSSVKMRKIAVVIDYQGAGTVRQEKSETIIIDFEK